MIVAAGVFLIFFLMALNSIPKALVVFSFFIFFTPPGFILLDVGGFPVITLNRSMVLGLLAAHMARCAVSSKSFFRGNTTIFKLACAFAGVGIVSSLVNGFNTNGASTSFLFLIENFFPAYLIYINRSPEFGKKLARYFVIGAGISIVATLLFYATDLNPFSSFISSTESTGRVKTYFYEGDLRGARALGTFSHPIAMGIFMCFAIFSFLLYSSLGRRKGGIAVYFWIFLAAVCIYSTNSRSPMIFLLVWFFVYLVRSRPKKTIKAVAVIFLVLLVSLFLFPSQIERTQLALTEIVAPDQVESLQGSSIEMRANQTAVALKYLERNYLLGNGVNTTRNLVESKAEEDLFGAESVLYSLMIDNGVLGIALFLLMFWVINKDLRRFSLIDGAVSTGFVVGYFVVISITGLLDTFQGFLWICAISIFCAKNYPERILAKQANRLVFKSTSVAR